MREFDNINDRLDYIEFHLKNIYNNEEDSRLYFEYEITREEAKAVMDIMDKYSEMINHGQKVYSGNFEQDIYGAIPSLNGDYHFCESIAKAYYELHRWPEVFPALYSGNKKFQHLFNQE